MVPPERRLSGKYQNVMDLFCGNHPRAPFQNKYTVSAYLTGIGISMLKERWPVGRLFFNMGLPIPVRRRLYIETGPSASSVIVLCKTASLY